MSEMAPEPPVGGGGNFMTQRIMGLPAIAWVGIIALGAYLYISHKNSSAANGAVSESGGGGSAKSGNTTIDKGAIQVTITQANPQPKPPTTHKKKTTHTPAPHKPPKHHGGPVHKVTAPHINEGPVKNPPPVHKRPTAKGSATPVRKAGAPHPAKKPAIHRATHQLKRH